MSEMQIPPFSSKEVTESAEPTFVHIAHRLRTFRKVSEDPSLRSG